MKLNNELLISITRTTTTSTYTTIRMGIFYLDTEFTNGNYYLGDIFEIALLSENSGRIFHSYVNIPSRIPRYIKKMCNVTDMIIRKSPPFCKVMNELIGFIEREDKEASSKRTFIIAHGGYLNDFPLLLTNCMRTKYDYTLLEKYTFIDSKLVFESKGYKRPGLDALSGKGDRRIHSAIEDVKLARDVIKKLLVIDITTTNTYAYTLQDILQYLEGKLPISIQNIYKIAAQETSYYSFESELYRHAVTKTALNENQVRKIAYRYFNR